MPVTHTGFDSVGARFLAQCDRNPQAEAFRYPDHADNWQSLTWSETAVRARELSAALLGMGVRAEDRVAVASSTRIEWVLADLGISLAGAAATTVYPTTNPEDVAFILTDCGAAVAFVENVEQLRKLRTESGFVGAIRQVVLFDGDSSEPGVLSWTAAIEAGRQYLTANPASIDEALAQLAPDHLATIIYTSGTTGRPKGVELTHGNWLYLGAAVATEEVVRPDHVQFLWLPLSHVFGKLLLAAQYEIGFITAIDGRLDRIIDNLPVIQPTFMAAAPRIFEKIYSRVATTATASGGLSAAAYRWAFSLGIAAVRGRQSGKRIPPWHSAALAIADRLVFSRIRSRFGGNLEYLVSGSAALAPQIAEWFEAAGLPILEGYGLTETTGASFVNRPGTAQIGTVGTAFPGMEVDIAEDGEILLRGPGVMRGYHNLPIQTAAVISPSGWFSTGDIGQVDESGFLTITDRKKDLAKTSGGKYIAPTAIESAVKSACPIVSQAVVIADGRHFASILLALDTAVTASMQQEAIRDTVRTSIDAVNASLNRWETIKEYRIIPRELSVEAGELTPSLKVKRAAVVANHAALIDEIYGRS
ncbi:AMP-dependent synthetase/ligase [Nocardia sp. NPDC055029]